VTVRIVLTRHPRETDLAHDGPYDEVLHFERAYQLQDRVIAVNPEGECRADGPRQFTRKNLIEVDFERLTLIPYAEMIQELNDDVDLLSAEDFDARVERLS